MSWITSKKEVLDGLTMGYRSAKFGCPVLVKYCLMRSIIKMIDDDVQWHDQDTIIVDLPEDFKVDVSFATAYTYEVDQLSSGEIESLPFGVIMFVVNHQAFITVVRKANFIQDQIDMPEHIHSETRAVNSLLRVTE